MTKFRFPFFISGLLAAFGGAHGAATAQSLQFASGENVLAEVLEASGDGLTVRRLDSGGILELRWDHLSEESAARIRTRFNLSTGEDTEPLVPADVIVWQKNGSRQEVIGRIVDRTDSSLVLEQRGTRITIPRTSVEAVRALQVPVSQVFTQNTWYQQRFAEIGPGQDADLHMMLAEEMMRNRDWDHADEHLKAAESHGNSKDPGRLAGLTDRLALYKEAAEERAMLDDIRRLRARKAPKDLAKGLELLEKFEKDFPQSKLQSEYDAEKKRFMATRSGVLVDKVSDMWRGEMRRVAGQRLAGGGASLSESRNFAESEMGVVISTRLAGKLDLDLEEVNELFKRRLENTRPRSPISFSYGVGSWLLGEAKINDGVEVEVAEPAGGTSGKDGDAKRLNERIQRAQARLKRAAGGGQAGETEEQWWDKASRSEKQQWIVAYYIDNSGDMQRVSARTTPCFLCGAKGFTEQLSGSGGKAKKTQCSNCKGTKRIRTVTAW